MTSVFRTVKESLGRYIAIMAIIALGVGFYSGLSLTMPSFMLTGRKYIDERKMFDFRIMSDIGFTEDELRQIRELDTVETADAAVFCDAVTYYDSDESHELDVVRFMSVTDGVNELKLIEGRLPEAPGEIVIDEYQCGSDHIGDTLVLEEDPATMSVDSGSGMLHMREYTIVGTVRSPLYLNFQRGTTNVGGGSISYFAYACRDTFSFAAYSEIYVRCGIDSDAYTDSYNDAATAVRPVLTGEVSEILRARYPDAQVYVMGRESNVGYMAFDNDAHIVEDLANVFPLFFFALAALVCSTTMQRMVTDERTSIGTMRAMGYSDTVIIMKYVIYSGSAAVSGCIIGYLVGTRLFPFVIWDVYGMMYGFAPISFAQDPMMFIPVLIVSLLCSVGVTVLTAAGELREMPAELIRPKAPVPGKRILLERIRFLWDRFPFLIKISARNVFRFKKRMWMMITGIAGCTALLLTGFGIRDSINGIVDRQYDDILTYDISMTFEEGVSAEEMERCVADTDDKFDSDSEHVLARLVTLKHNGKDAVRDVYLIVSDDPSVSDAVNSLAGGSRMPWPGDGEIAISSKLADKNGIDAGDEVTFEYGEGGQSFTLRVAYVFDNYIYHYAYMNGATYEEVFRQAYTPDTVLIMRDGDTGSAADDYDYASYMAYKSPVKAWSAVDEMRTSFRQTMEKLNSVVLLIIGCAAMLAFIVLFNLNNINITERIREIATLKVLGFNRPETGAYVFRENTLLIVIGFILGIPLGILLHGFVMSRIEMDTVTFVVRILPRSYLYSLGFVILFSTFVDFIMLLRIEKINMAESLKSAE